MKIVIPRYEVYDISQISIKSTGKEPFAIIINLIDGSIVKSDKQYQNCLIELDNFGSNIKTELIDSNGSIVYSDETALLFSLFPVDFKINDSNHIENYDADDIAERLAIYFFPE